MSVKQPRIRRDGWPVEIPWPTEDEFTSGAFLARTRGGDRCCLVGWIRVAFHGDPNRMVSQKFPRARQVVERMASFIAHARPRDVYDATRVVADFNDFASDSQRAAIWAATWLSFGYKETP